MPMPLFSLQNSHPLLTHNFIAFFGAVPLSFAKVSNIEIAIETQALAEGGQNGFVHSLSGAVAGEKTLVLERGVGAGILGDTPGPISPVATIAARLLQPLRVGSIFERIILCVLDATGLPKKVYLVTHAVLKKRSLSDLDALSSEVYIERLELVYRNLTQVLFASMPFMGLKKVVSLLPGESPPPAPFTPPKGN